jgi:hypothetical protein
MRKLSVIFTSLTLLILTSCGLVTEQVAKDDLVGKYVGKVNWLYKYSLLNVGLSDKTKEVSVNISFYKNDKEDVFVRTGDGNIRLSNVTLASNGTAFNIPYQMVVNKDGETHEVEGNPTSTLNGGKYDGLFFSEEGSLSFGYTILIDYEYYGQQTQLPVICTYTCSKVN